MRQDLIATFAKSSGGSHNWTYHDVDPNLSTQTIKEACELLTTLDIFEQDGVKLFDSVVTAKIVTYKERLIFDLEHDPEDSQPEVEQPSESTCEEVGCFEVFDKPEIIENQTSEGDILRKKCPASLISMSTSTRITPAMKQLPSYSLGNLTSIEKLESTVITAEENSLIEMKKNSPPHKRTSVSTAEQDHSTIQPAFQKKKEHSGLLHWFRGKRKRKKDDPANTP